MYRHVYSNGITHQLQFARASKKSRIWSNHCICLLVILRRHHLLHKSAQGTGLCLTKEATELSLTKEPTELSQTKEPTELSQISSV